jgi:hypothetical protein
MQEHDIGSDPNWRVQYGKGIYIEITLPKILFVYTFCSFHPGDGGASYGCTVLETVSDNQVLKAFLSARCFRVSSMS